MPYITWETKNTEYRVAGLPLGKPDQPQNLSLSTSVHLKIVSKLFKLITRPRNESKLPNMTISILYEVNRPTN